MKYDQQKQRVMQNNFKIKIDWKYLGIVPKKLNPKVTM